MALHPHFSDRILVKEISEPNTPDTGQVAVYAKADGKLYIKDDAGTETDLTATGSGGLTDVTENLHTASPNNTVNALQLDVTGGSTNTDLVLTPKGTGAFILGPEPDGTATGGNKRGVYAVDLGMDHSGYGATFVASGAHSSITGGWANMASGSYSHVGGGFDCRATGSQSVVGGGGTNQATALASSVLGGTYCFATGMYSAVLGGAESTASGESSSTTGRRSVADRYGIHVHSNGRFAANGDAQSISFVQRGTTTTNAAVELFTDTATRFTIPSGKVNSCFINLVGVKSDGSAVARFMRQVTIKNVAGTTSLVGSVITIGADIDAGTTISITANDTNDAIKIEATGIESETWRWVAAIDTVEVAYGT